MVAEQQVKASEAGKKVNGTASGGKPNYKKIVVDRRVYKAELCKDTPLHGEFLGFGSINTGRTDNPHWVFGVVRTIDAVKSVDRDGNIGESKAGEEVMFTISAKLAQYLATPLADKANTYRVWIKPLGKVKLDGGKTMWDYDVSIDLDNPIPRKSPMPAFTASSVAGLLSASNAPAQQQEMAVEGEEIPF